MLRWMIGSGLALAALCFVAPPGLYAGGSGAERLELRARPDGIQGMSGTVTFTDAGSTSVDLVVDGDGTALIEGEIFAAVGDEVDDSGTGTPLEIDGDLVTADGLTDFAEGRSLSILIKGIGGGGELPDMTVTIEAVRVRGGRTVPVALD